MVLIGGFVVFVLEKTHVINLYHKTTPRVSATTKPTSSIDYSPATANDNANNDQIKKNSLGDTPQSQPLNVTITRLTQNPDTKTLIVRALVEGASTGTCTLEFSQSNNPPQLTRQAQISQQNNIFICNGYDIPQSELPGTGTWSVKLTINDGSNSAFATQNIMIEK